MNVDKSIILLMNIYLATIFVRLYKMNCDKHILTEKLNELLIQIFEKMLKKKIYILFVFLVLWVYCARGYTNDFKKDLLEITIAVTAACLLNVIVHDKKVIIPLIMFVEILVIVFDVEIFCIKIESIKDFFFILIGNILCGWLICFINNNVNER